MFSKTKIKRALCFSKEVRKYKIKDIEKLKINTIFPSVIHYSYNNGLKRIIFSFYETVRLGSYRSSKTKVKDLVWQKAFNYSPVATIQFVVLLVEWVVDKKNRQLWSGKKTGRLENWSQHFEKCHPVKHRPWLKTLSHRHHFKNVHKGSALWVSAIKARRNQN